VIKTLGAHFVEAWPGQLNGVFPRRLPRQPAGPATVEPAPVMVQQFVASGRELRVYWVAGEFMSFDVRKGSAEELWTQPQSVQVSSVATPEGLRAPLSRLAARWRLDVAAFDLLQTADGYVFLEVNVLCDWRWFERAAGCTTVTAAVTTLMEKMFRRQQP
jgi:glutathione synthase/RimK-type ligase-like ATP-grasp enzyme